MGNMTITVDRENRVITVTIDGMGKTYRGDFVLYQVFAIMMKFWEKGGN